jgi:RHS repeat-associated protein
MPRATAATTGAATPMARAGQLPISVGPPPSKAAKTSTTAASMQVQVLRQSAARASGLDGVLFRVRRTDSSAAVPMTVSVDYSGFRNAYGGDWAQRLQLVSLPACAVTTPSAASCRTGKLIPSTNNALSDRVSATTTATSSNALFAVAAAPDGTSGDYTATSLSAAGTWQVSTQGGEFSWSYPMAVPSVPGSLEPSIAANYSSSAVDGQTATSNNQPSWIGNGWDLGVGFIERGYQSCFDANVGTPANQTGDECWGPDNATLSLNGRSTPLVKVSNTVWRARDDNGETVQHVTGGVNGDDNGEYWVVTETSGVKYYFGLNRLPGWTSSNPTTQSVWTVPVFGADPENSRPGESFAASVRQQAYRWNLDYVVDPHADAIAYYYQQETNSYAERLGAATGSYTRAGYLDRADYGLRDGAAYSSPAPAQVAFGAAPRCAPGADCTQHTAAAFPDTPWDQSCPSGPCGTHYSPSYWSAQRLSTVTTQVWNGSAYAQVDRWTLDQTYPDPGDGTGDAMWLQGITHTGLDGGSASTPETIFVKHSYQNRLLTNAAGLPQMAKFRITSIENGSGGTIDVNYKGADCNTAVLPAPDSNTTRCYPVTWTPPGFAAPVNDWFTKYVVDQTTQQDRVGGNPNEYTYYAYPGGAAWRYDDNPLIPAARRTWSQWRGYSTVTVDAGDPNDTASPQSETKYLFYRGMNGDHLGNGGTRSATITDSQGTAVTDADQDAGMAREVITDKGVNGAVVTDVINTPWQNGPTATQGTLNAYMVEVGKTVTRTALSAGGWRTTETDTTFNTNDLPVQVSDLGDASTSATADDRCTTTTYTTGAGGLVDLAAEVATVAVACGVTPTLPDDAISDVTTTYNPAGDALATATLASYSGTRPVMLTTATSSYDQYGRVTSTTDALGRKTSTAYLPATGPMTETDVTDPSGNVTKTTYDAGLAKPLTVTAPGNRVTTLAYDPLGRLIKEWSPGRATTATPSEQFGYSVTGTSASWQRTAKLDANGSYQTSYVVYDGFLRQRQTQTPTHSSDSAVWSDIVDTFYDSRGQVAMQSGSYDTATAPSGALQVTSTQLVPLETLDGYDGAGRPTGQLFEEYGKKVLDAAGNVWSTTTSYGGDHVDVTPAAGATPTTTYTDARGQTTELRQYHGASPTGTYDATKYTYTKAGQLATVVDAAGDKWTYGYDLRGRKVSATDPDSGASTMAYDKDGELTSTTDARKQTIANVYDALGRKTEERQDSPTGTLLGSWGYDPATGDLLSTNTFVGGDQYTQSMTYDAAGRPRTTSVVVPSDQTGLAGTYLSRVSYEPDNSVNTQTLPALGNVAAETLQYKYDALGYPSSMSGGAYYVAAASYGQDNAVSQLQVGPDSGGVVESIGHDVSTDRLTQSVVQPLIGSGNIDQAIYSYDLSGSVTSESDTMTGQAVQKQCFAYDYLQRLTQAWTTTASNCSGAPGSSLGGSDPYWQSYTYDPLGDRTQQVQHATQTGVADTTSTYTYSDAAHPQGVTSVKTTGPAGPTTASFGYDAAGNTTARPAPDGSTQALTWTPDGKLASISDGTQNANYVYDADGHLLVSHDSNGSTLYLPIGELHVDANGGSPTGTRYYTFGGHTVAVRTGATLSWLAGDNHGTSDLTVDATTMKATKHRVDPFGNPLDKATIPGDRGFIGGTVDGSTGLTTIGARDYDPTLGRFISVDPLITPSRPATFDPYTYAADNPATLSDPSGMNTVGMGCPDRDCNSVGGGPNAPKPGPAPAPKPVNHFPGSHGGANSCPDRDCTATHNLAPHMGPKYHFDKATFNAFAGIYAARKSVLDQYGCDILSDPWGYACMVDNHTKRMMFAAQTAGVWASEHPGIVAAGAGLICAATTVGCGISLTLAGVAGGVDVVGCVQGSRGGCAASILDGLGFVTFSLGKGIADIADAMRNGEHGGEALVRGRDAATGLVLGFAGVLTGAPSGSSEDESPDNVLAQMGARMVPHATSAPVDSSPSAGSGGGYRNDGGGPCFGEPTCSVGN